MRSIHRVLRLLVLVVSIAAGTILMASVLRRYDPEPWLEDLAQLEQGAASAYANLEWQIGQGVVDPVALHQRSDSLIRHASSDREARGALNAFAAAFQDGHFRVRRDPPRFVERAAALWRGRQNAPPPLSFAPDRACRAVGFSQDRDAGLLAQASTYQPLDHSDPNFATGVIALSDGRRAGVVRIASFGTHNYRSACEEAWRAMADGAAPASTCDDDCQSELALATANLLLAELRSVIRQLDSAQVDLLVVDLTGNGGGTDWADPAARQFSSAALRGQRVGFIRHSHWERPFHRSREALDSALGDPAISPTQRDLLESARAIADSALNRIARPCDRSALWTRGLAAVPCRQLVTDLTYVSGLVEYLPRDVAREVPGGTEVFWPAAYDFEEGVWRGPLVILADRGTASASEQFIALLRDNDAARVAGEKTYGAGCGFTDGGIPLRLRHSGLRVTMPDCARIRRNGMNEVAGITPDVSAGWTDDDAGKERAEKAVRAVAQAVAR